MLTPLELDIMKAVWQTSPITVKDVQATIRPRRKLAYTTVMTIMHRLFQKGFLSRKLRSRTHYYEPAVAYATVREAEVRRVVQEFFAGSSDRLIDFLEESDGHEPAVERLMVQPPPQLDETLL